MDLKRIILFLGVILLPFFVSGQDENWHLRLNKDGILVYTARTDRSDLESFKGVTVIESSLSSLVALLADVNHYSGWMYKTADARILEREGNGMYIYTVSEAPWPVKPRDNIHFSRLVQHPETREIMISIKAIPDYLPKNDHYVRIPDASGFWKLKPLGNGKVQVTYQMKTDSGGSIPAWLANLAVTQAPFQMLTNLRREIGQTTYRNAVIPGIEEL